MSPQAVPPNTIVPGFFLDNGRYQVLRKLGEGGGGVVWLAIHTKMNAHVAVKFPHKDVVGTNNQFDEEIKLHVKFSNQHPHYVSILDVGHVGDQPYIVMQYLANGCLADRIAARKQCDLILSPVNWLKATADALDYLHSNNLVHRDVKPANILLDDSMSAYLSDFGIAKAVITQKGKAFELFSQPRPTIAGSLPYLAPEVLRTGDARYRSDQYALGISVYEFLTGARPFSSQSIKGLMAEHALPVPPLAYCDEPFPTPIQSAVLKALSPNPDLRYGSCGEFANAILNHWPLINSIHEKVNAARNALKIKPVLPAKNPDSGTPHAKPPAGENAGTATSSLSDQSTEGKKDGPSSRKIKLSRLNRPKGPG